MGTKRFTDWGSWWDGLRNNLLKCLGTSGTAWLGSNGIAASGIPGLDNIGLNWKQGLGVLAIHLLSETFAYIKDNQPKVVVETVETTYTSKSSDGTNVNQGSKTVTTTPNQTQ